MGWGHGAVSGAIGALVTVRLGLSDIALLLSTMACEHEEGAKIRPGMGMPRTQHRNATWWHNDEACYD